ncbi:MAG: DUF4445 domain-containing protein [Clostridia bacterium]|nr:DUF4445 domain-containing protein [Clostridia bacterium]
MKNNVNVNVNGKTVPIKKGTVLSDILDVEKPCGGHGKCGKCKVLVNGKEELACRYTVLSDIEVKTPENGNIYSETGVGECEGRSGELCFALDIGTTTIALALVSVTEKKTVRVITSTNPQRKFGSDIMTRIDYCQKKSVKELHDVLIDRINGMISEFGAGEVETVYVSANATMLHTFFGIDCASIGVAPYTPAFLDSKEEKADALGLVGVKRVVSLPSLSSFVGADIVAGLYCIGMPDEGKYNMLIDLGTNAEVVLYSNRSGVASAAAAGPCFEGANISCGMSASSGAVYAFELNGGKASFKTIENERAVGICGTGLIDIISELLKNQVIDESGFMEEDFLVSDGVYISPEDVRQYQLAKSAIYSAVLSLMKKENVGFENVCALYISGGFSSKINVKNAAESGLIPRALVSKARALNNTSLQGTIKYIFERGNLRRYVDTIKYVDLSEDKCFNELFIENMTFDS